MKEKIKYYPDKASYIQTEPLSSLTEDGDIGGVFRINSYQDIWHLSQHVDALNNRDYRPTIIIPCLYDSQADRRFNKGESFGLKLVIEALAAMDANFQIFHPHNPEVVEMGFELLGNPVEIIDNTDFIREVLVKIDRRDEGLVILFPDAGAYKWGIKLLDKLNFQGDAVPASKSRSYKDEKSKLTQQLPNYDFKGKTVLIIDDISIYGNTFKGLSKLLTKADVDNIYLAISHMTVQNIGKNPFTNYFEKVFVTNSKYEEYYFTSSKGSNLLIDINLEIIRMF